MRLPLLGLFGEVGSLLSEPKRRQREKATVETYHDSLTEEVGDVLWYLSNLATRHRVRLSALARAPAIGGRRGALQRSDSRLTFGQVSRATTLPPGRYVGDSEFFALGGAVGRLMNEFVTGDEWGLDRQEFLRHLAFSFHLLVRTAIRAKISMDFVAYNNLAKINSRWPKRQVFQPLFDKKCHADEQLPRLVEMHFSERTIEGKKFVFQRCNGINIGDRLTDNKAQEDDYRFHDVFHLAYMAILGWSPVMRALFQVKRKSLPRVDENEDGARAILIEEGIATWMFNQGLEHQHFRHLQKLDYAVLKTVRQFVAGYEVEQCPLWQWELAILRGFEMFRLLKKHRGGLIVANLKEHTVTFAAPLPRPVRRET
jgi:hypothetical protein